MFARLVPKYKNVSGAGVKVPGDHGTTAGSILAL
jgi:hypothetical protein